jgi:HEPN domain-containing protein
MMTTEEKINHWRELSNEDLKVAEDLLSLKHFLYVAFMCHQSIEKIMKAYYVKLNEDTPPFIHDLFLISSRGGFYDVFSEEQKNFIHQLSPLNIRTRYPEYRDLIYRQLTQHVCKQILEQTTQLHQWISERLL